MATEVGKGLKRLHQARLQEQDVHADMIRLYNAVSAAHARGEAPDPELYAQLSARVQESFLLACDSTRAVDHSLQHLAPLIARRLPPGEPKPVLVLPSYTYAQGAGSTSAIATTAVASTPANTGGFSSSAAAAAVAAAAMAGENAGPAPAVSTRSRAAGSSLCDHSALSPTSAAAVQPVDTSSDVSTAVNSSFGPFPALSPSPSAASHPATPASAAATAAVAGAVGASTSRSRRASTAAATAVAMGAALPAAAAGVGAGAGAVMTDDDGSIIVFGDEKDEEEEQVEIDYDDDDDHGDDGFTSSRSSGDGSRDTPSPKPPADLFVTSDGTLARPESPSLPLLTPLLPAPALRRGDLWSWHLGPPATAQALPVGLEVAALADAENDLWIVGRIAALRPRVLPRPQIYEVVDVEQELLAADAAVAAAATGVRTGRNSIVKRLALPALGLIPLPSLREFPPQARADFQPGTRVLALYPVENISSLYPCSVIKSARKRGDTVYEVVFDDDGGVVRKVSAKYIVPIPHNT